ncbi:MAG: DUF2798 domain-containing protein [Rhizobiaceae bacterium]
MKPFIPKRFEAIAFGLLLSGMMTFFVSGISTVLAVGLVEDIFAKWMKAWAYSWAVAFPIVLFVAPTVRRILHRVVRPD